MFSRDVLLIPHRLTVPYICAGSNRAGSSGAIQIPPQDLLQEDRRLHQGAGSALQLQRAGHQPEHDNVLWLRRISVLGFTIALLTARNISHDGIVYCHGIFVIIWYK